VWFWGSVHGCGLVSILHCRYIGCPADHLAGGGCLLRAKCSELPQLGNLKKPLSLT
jgi:hypothetical protein